MKPSVLMSRLLDLTLANMGIKPVLPLTMVWAGPHYDCCRGAQPHPLWLAGGYLEEYPPGLLNRMDRHTREAFLAAGCQGAGPPQPPRLPQHRRRPLGLPRRDRGSGDGDCDDTAALVTSLLCNFLPEDRLFATAGLFGSCGGHVWITAYGSGALVLESTLAEALPGPWGIPEEESYIPFIRFNDLVVEEVRELLEGFLSRRLSIDGAL